MTTPQCAFVIDWLLPASFGVSQGRAFDHMTLTAMRRGCWRT
jgi:hypothetical protein